MATYFGEILPTFSRAVDEDEDEDDSPCISSTCSLEWSPDTAKEIEESSTKCVKCSVLVLAVGTTAAGFADVYLLNAGSTRLGRIHCGDDASEPTKKSRDEDRCCSIYRLKKVPDVLVAVCRTNIQPEQAFSFTEQLLSCLSPDNLSVVVLSSNAASMYKTEQYGIPVPFLRCLTSSQHEGAPVCPYVEQPNTIAGLPAQVLSYCEMKHMPAVLYTCYSETLFLDADSIHTFQSIFKVAPLNTVASENPKAKEHIRKLMDKHAQENQLYL